MRALKRAKPRGIPLSDLRVGESARVVSMDLDEETAWKFMEMGFGVGRRLRLVRRAPLGDPMELELLGYHLAVRSEDVEGILVRPLKGA